MPRVKRRRKRRRETELNQFQVWYYEEGVPLLCQEWSEDAEAVEAGWEEVRDQVIPLHPFYRPWGWWKFDATEKLRVRQPDETPSPLVVAILAKFEGFRCPSAIERMQRDDHRLEYETEAEYLIRLDLLTDRERELLAELQAELGTDH